MLNRLFVYLFVCLFSVVQTRPTIYGKNFVYFMFSKLAIYESNDTKFIERHRSGSIYSRSKEYRIIAARPTAGTRARLLIAR